MGPLNGVNLERVKYFNIEEYIDRIKLSSDVLYHVEDTSKAFEEYIKFLSSGGADYPLNILKELGIDIEDENTLQGVYEIFNKKVKLLKELTK